MRSYIKWSIIILTIIFIYCISFVGIKSFLGKNRSTEVKVNPKVEKQVIINKEIDIQDKDKDKITISAVTYNLLDEHDVYRLIHEMANTIVVADQSIRYVAIEPDRVELLLAEVNKSNWDDKAKLLENLNRWKNNDFSHGVEEHNYVWKKLGGEIGKATALLK